MGTVDRHGAPPRVVVVSRPSELTLLIARHATKEQARFFLRQREQPLEPVEAAHHAQEAALGAVLASLPLGFRRAKVGREDLGRFLFEPGDVIAAVGQDGLVANVAKYLEGQPVIGVSPSATPTVLMHHTAAAFPDVLADVLAGRSTPEARTMVEVRLDDGQRLRSLNEIFVGHRSHQSARYRIWAPNGAPTECERQSSSGLIAATGTGATGWAASVARQSASPLALPAPTDPSLAFFVREAWPSPQTGTSIVRGALGPTDVLSLRSEMNEGGVIFGDGMESDRLLFGWGQRADIRVSPTRLHLA